MTQIESETSHPRIGARKQPDLLKKPVHRLAQAYVRQSNVDARERGTRKTASPAA